MRSPRLLATSGSLASRVTVQSYARMLDLRPLQDSPSALCDCSFFISVWNTMEYNTFVCSPRSKCIYCIKYCKRHHGTPNKPMHPDAICHMTYLCAPTARLTPERLIRSLFPRPTPRIRNTSQHKVPTFQLLHEALTN